MINEQSLSKIIQNWVCDFWWQPISDIKNAYFHFFQDNILNYNSISDLLSYQIESGFSAVSYCRRSGAFGSANDYWMCCSNLSQCVHDWHWWRVTHFFVKDDVWRCCWLGVDCVNITYEFLSELGDIPLLDRDWDLHRS